MTPKGIAYSTALGLGIAGAAILWTGHLRIERLRDELALRRSSARQAARPSPRATPVAATPPAPAPATASGERNSGAATERPPARGPEPASKATPLLRVPATAWSHQGGATPATCFESVLLASVQGDTEKLGAMLTCDDPVRQALAEAFAKIPPELRKAHASPEHLLASMVAVQIPDDLSAYGVLGERPVNATETVVAMRMERARGRQAESYFVFRREGGAWRLVVPAQIVGEIIRNVAGPGAALPGAAPAGAR